MFNAEMRKPVEILNNPINMKLYIYIYIYIYKLLQIFHKYKYISLINILNNLYKTYITYNMISIKINIFNFIYTQLYI